MQSIVIGLGLYMACLGLLYVLGNISRWQTARRWKRQAQLAQTQPEIPVYVDEAVELSDRAQYLLLSHEISRPLFAVPPLLDGGTVVRDYGKN